MFCNDLEVEYNGAILIFQGFLVVKCGGKMKGYRNSIGWPGFSTPGPHSSPPHALAPKTPLRFHDGISGYRRDRLSRRYVQVWVGEASSELKRA